MTGAVHTAAPAIAAAGTLSFFLAFYQAPDRKSDYRDQNGAYHYSSYVFR